MYTRVYTAVLVVLIFILVLVTSSTRSSTGTAVVLNFKLALVHVEVLNLVSPREGTGYWVLQNTVYQLVYPGRSTKFSMSLNLVRYPGTQYPCQYYRGG